MKSLRIALVALCMVGGGRGIALAQDLSPSTDAVVANPGAKLDGLVVQIVAEKKIGAVIVSAAMGCSSRARFEIGQMTGGALTRVASVRAYDFKAGVSGTLVSLKPGEYYFWHAYCMPGPKFVGPHAKFQVRAGELANLGTIKLTIKTEGILSVSGTLQKSIGPLRPETAAYLKSRIPKSFPRAVSRPMTVVGPATSKISIL
jgi:hypothetical protein